MMHNALVLQNVSKVFQQGDETRIVLDDISYEFKQGTSYAITGISGSGKSTLLSLLAGIDKPTSGRALLKRGEKIEDLHVYAGRDPREFFHRTVGIVFQSPCLIHELSVLENVFLKGIIAGESSAVCIKQAQALLDSVNLAHKAHARCATLSIGEQQRVSLARALFSQPAFLLADEPTAHLDVINRELMMRLIRDYQSRLSAGVIIVCHDRVVAESTDIQTRLLNGRLIHEGEQVNV